MSEAAAPPVLEAVDLARYFDVSRPALQRWLAREPRRIGRVTVS